MSIKYKETADKIRQEIIKQASPVSCKLPTEMDLCKRYGVSRQTIRQALELLAKDGLIYSRQGSGIFTIPLSSYLEGKVVFLLSSENEYTYPAFLSSMRDLLSKEKITPVIHITNQDYNTERRILQHLLEQSPMVLVTEGIRDTFTNPNLDLYEKLLKANVSIISLHSNSPALPGIFHISSEDIQGGALLGEHLIHSGIYQVSAILPDFINNAKDRYQGLLTAYRDHSLPMPSNEIFWYSYSDLEQLRRNRNTQFLHNIIRMHKKGEGYFCYNDEIAYWLLKEFAHAGITVPDEASVVSFDNSYLCRISTPPLTSLSLEKQALEKELTQQILHLLQRYSQTTEPLAAYPKTNRRQTSQTGLLSERQYASQTVLLNQTPVHFANYLIGHEKTLPWKLISRSSVL